MRRYGAGRRHSGTVDRRLHGAFVLTREKATHKVPPFQDFCLSFRPEINLRRGCLRGLLPLLFPEGRGSRSSLGWLAGQDGIPKGVRDGVSIPCEGYSVADRCIDQIQQSEGQ